MDAGRNQVKPLKEQASQATNFIPAASTGNEALGWGSPEEHPEPSRRVLYPSPQSCYFYQGREVKLLLLPGQGSEGVRNILPKYKRINVYLDKNRFKIQSRFLIGYNYKNVANQKVVIKIILIWLPRSVATTVHVVSPTVLPPSTSELWLSRSVVTVPY